MKTLLLALVSNGKSRGTREGAIRGLMGVGKDAIRKGLIEGHGAKVAAQESQMPGYSSLAETVMVCSKLFSTCARLLIRHYDPRTRLPPYSLGRSRLYL
jgi:transcription initiation factor TFIID subunit 6